MLNQILEILDEAFENCEADDDSGYDYRLCDQKGLNMDVNGMEVLTVDTMILKDNHQNDSEIKDEINNFHVTANKNENVKCDEMNAFTESLVIVFVLFSLYSLLSSLI